jgi:uncharacterized protein (UPF0548 family)
VDHYEAPVPAPAGESPAAVFERVRGRLFGYDIFPPRLIPHAVCPDGCIDVGSTIVQRVMLGPFGLEAAVRVVDAWNRQEGAAHEAGFSYVTLEGHPECGVATFRVRLDRSGRVTVLVDARSVPGTRLTRLGRPLARGFQKGITIAGLRRLAGS